MIAVISVFAPRTIMEGIARSAGGAPDVMRRLPIPVALLRRLVGAAATLTVASANIVAQDSLALRRRAEFDSVVAANRHDVVLDGARVTGPGIDWLVGEAASSHTFLIGEQHLTREITLVEDALLRRLVGIGYTHLAIEVGPYSTRVAEGLIRRDSLEAFLSSPGNGLTIPFLFELEFAEMTAAFVRAVPGRGPVLMGLDQEFVNAAPLLSSLVTGAARTAEEREAARAFTDVIRANPSLIGQSDGTALRALRDGFRSTRDSSMRRMVDDLLLSHAIYAPFTGRGGSVRDANLLRETYIKRNFAEQLAAARSRGPVKVAGVWGANHAMRGFTPTYVVAYGSFVEETSIARGERLFNLHVDCLGGTMRDPQSGNAVPCPPYYLTGDGALRAQVAADRPTLIDLRPLRSRLGRWSFLTERERMLILGYDAYLAIPNVTPATMFGSSPGGRQGPR